MRSTLVYLMHEIEALQSHPETLSDAHRTEIVCAEWILRIRQALEGTPRILPEVPRGVVVLIDPAARPLSLCPPGHAIGQVDRWVAVLEDGSHAATCASAAPLIRWCRQQASETRYLFDLALLERP